MNEADQEAIPSTDRLEHPEELYAQEQLRLAALIKDVSLAFIQSTSLSDMTQQCAEALVSHFDAAFARIWTLNGETQVLELQASAGLYTHLNGSHSRIPMGAFKIGLIASERLPHLTNEVLSDPRVNDQQWARHEGMIAFAGYPLLVADRLIGVMALFARHTLSPSTLDAMASVANTIAVGIDRKLGELERLRLLFVEQQARQTAEAAQKRLINILDHLTDGFMIFDTEWRYSYINPYAKPFAGKPQEELLGKNVWDVFPELIGSTFYQQYHHAMTAQEAVSFRIFSQALANWFDIRAYPIVDGLVVYFRQITEQVRAEEEKKHLLEATQQARLEAEAARLRVTDILESINDAFFALDSQWCFTYLNLHSEPLLQRRREDLLGKNIWDEFPEAVGSSFYKQYHLALEQQISVRFEDVYPPLNTWFEVHAYPVPDGLSIYYHNINERKEAEKERERLLHLERKAHNEAEAALSVRSSFLSSVSHDLRTPLATIKANFQLVQRRVKQGRSLENDWLNERLESIERATTKMAGMIEDLLDIGRIQTQQRPNDAFRPFDLLLLVRQAIAEQQAASKRHQLIFKTSVTQLPIRGNAPRLDRVLTNLLGNAVKYSPRGGEIIIEVTVEDQAWARISIQDHGVGIPAPDLPHIFEPFHRASNVTDSIQGTGVGLASVAQVIEQHQGTISVTSEEQQGSCFIVRLPLVSETATQSSIEGSR